MDERYNEYSRRFIDALNNRDKKLPVRGNCVQLRKEERRRRKEEEKEEKRLRRLRRRDELLRESQRRNHKDKQGKRR